MEVQFGDEVLDSAVHNSSFITWFIQQASSSAVRDASHLLQCLVFSHQSNCQIYHAKTTLTVEEIYLHLPA